MAAILPLLFGVALVGSSQTDVKLPVYWEAPEFTLLNQLGDTSETADLRGTPWVASFVVTNCTDVCRLITRRMAVLRDTLAAAGLLGTRVRLVSFTVDPARDTPEVLQNYAAKFGVSSPDEWAFLTGMPADRVRRTIQEGFKLAASASTGHKHAGGNYQVIHSPRIVLVDARGRIRGLYDMTEPDAVEQLRHGPRALLGGESS